jgi:hypothetical protein
MAGAVALLDSIDPSLISAIGPVSLIVTMGMLVIHDCGVAFAIVIAIVRMTMSMLKCDDVHVINFGSVPKVEEAKE